MKMSVGYSNMVVIGNLQKIISYKVEKVKTLLEWAEEGMWNDELKKEYRQPFWGTSL